MSDAAVNLAVHDHRINQPAGILHREIPKNAHATSFDVDLNFDNVTSVGVSELVDAKCSAGFKPRFDGLGKWIARRTLKNARQVAKLHGKLRRTDHAHFAVGDLKVAFGGLEHLTGKL